MADDDTEKTEAPTPRRKQEAREEGNIARSQDLTAAATLLATVILLNLFGMHVLSAMRVTVETMLRSELGTNPTRADDITGMFAYGLRLAVAGAAPLLLSIAGITLVAAVSQVGFILTGKPLMPQFSRISPLSGLQRLFDARAGVRLVMSLAKVIVIAAVAVWVVVEELPQILLLTELEIPQLFSGACELVYSLALKLALLLVVLALLDYGFQRWQHDKDLRMSKQEVKEEMKRMEGDPLVKQRRSRVARQLAMQRVGQAVPKADVIVTNPTHFAVALQYDATTMRAPKVVAKGADFLAMHIRQLAAAHGVPIIERKELARALYANVEPGQEVPPEFYNAVAEILAYVYRIGKRSA
jgi:flagellar biosynthetic protein FlhB